MYQPLADRLRPNSIDEVVGQRHILGEQGVLRRIIQGGNIPNLIFYGPSGTGKTTVAEIAAAQMHRPFHRLNATTASLADIKAITADVGTLLAPEGVVLYLDEIQYLNKKQQQTLLEFLENGQITLIASTTENPYFYIYNAIISRSTVFEFKPVTPEEIEKALTRGVKILEAQAQEQGFSLTVEDHVLRSIALSCGGDVRKSINTLEVAFLSAPVTDGVKSITAEQLRSISQRAALRYDKSDDVHYDLLSALQKSIRGSDPDAAVHYLGRLLEAGDLLSPCRRLLVIAAEDIGLAYPQAIVIVKACVDAAVQLGLPEARIPLAEAAVLLATAPKSNASYMAINAAMADIQKGRGQGFPRCLQNVHYDSAEVEQKGQNYLYPHDFPNHWVAQQYLPDDLIGTRYYHYGDNKTEQAARTYWETRKKEK